jgi:hypothetical protein
MLYLILVSSTYTSAWHEVEIHQNMYIMGKLTVPPSYTQHNLKTRPNEVYVRYYMVMQKEKYDQSSSHHSLCCNIEHL